MAKFPTFPLLFDEMMRLSICDLRKWKYLEGNKSGSITWSRNDVVIASVSIAVNLTSDASHLALSYTINAEPIHYRVPLICVPSNLGKGVVWYFLCPFTAKRCRVLYLAEKHFVHRDAIKGMYESQTYSKRFSDLKKVFDYSFDDSLFEALSSKHFRTSYQGKITKRYARLLNKTEQRERALMQIEMRRLFR